MQRRQFLAAAGAATAVGTVASPAIAQSMPEVKWRLTSSYPKSLDTIYGAGEVFARAVAEATDNRFQIQVFGPGEVVPALQALDAVQNGTVECCHSTSSFYVGKDPTFAFGTAVPFGLNARQQIAWLYQGGGNELLGEFYRKYGVHAMPLGNTAGQMGGWFRKEVRSLADLSGLKMRIAGIAGQVIGKFGAVPQQIAGGDIYPALEKGTIDAVEWLGPYDDEKLGFVKIAPFYYYPGWWEGAATTHLFVNQAKWNELPKLYQTAINHAAIVANNDMIAKYDARNPAALKRLLAAGAQLRPFSPEIMDGCYKAASELYADLSAKNPEFKRVHDAMMTFRNDAYLWWQVTEHSFDNYMIRAARGRG